MCEKISEKINEFLDAGKIFTAYMITTSLRDEGVRINHKDVKKTIAEFDLTVYCYSKTQCLSDVFNPKPWIYYPDDLEETNEITKFEKSLIESVSGESDSSSNEEEGLAVSGPLDLGEVIDDNWDWYADSRSKVTIPNSSIKLFAKPGDILQVISCESEKTIAIMNLIDGAEIDTLIDNVFEGLDVINVNYTVDKSSNIRISNKLLFDSVDRISKIIDSSNNNKVVGIFLE